MPKTLGEFERLILFALLDLRNEEAYGVSVRRSIETRTGKRLSSGAVYTALERLERHGLVSSWIGEPTTTRGGRRKRLFRIEPAGREALLEAVQTFERMSLGLLPLLRSDDPA